MPTPTEALSDRKAFRSAGCVVVGVLNEPSAASIEFGHKTKISGVILVYDLGGGTFDASLVEVGEKTHRPLAIRGRYRHFGRRLISTRSWRN